MRKGKPVAYTQPCTQHARHRRRHRLGPEHGRRASHVEIIGLPMGLDRWSARALAEPPAPIDPTRESPENLTVPCCSARAPHFWLSSSGERWVLTVCVALVFALVATVAAGGGVWVGLQ